MADLFNKNLYGQTSSVNTKDQYIQSPDNPSASIKNPNYVKPSDTATTQDGTKIKPSSVLDIGSIEPPVNTIKNDLTVDNASSVAEASQKLIDEAKKKTEESKKGLTETTSKLGGTGETVREQIVTAAENAPKSQYQTTLATEQEKQGVQDLTNKVSEQNLKVATIKGDIEKLNTEQENELNAARANYTTTDAYDRYADSVKRDYASKKAVLTANLAAEAALSAAYSGNLDNAQTLVKQAVDAYTQDYSYETKKFENMLTLSASWINQLEDEEKDVLNKAYQEAKITEENAKADKEEVGNLMIQYNAYGAGINLDDTIESAKAKAAKANISKVAKEEAKSNNLGLTDTQLIAGSVVAGMTPKAFSNLSLEEQAQYVTGNYSDKLTAYSDLVNSGGITAATTAINNDNTLPASVKSNLLNNLTKTAKANLATQKYSLDRAGKEGDYRLKITNNETGKSQDVFSEPQLDVAAKNLGRGFWFVGGSGARDSVIKSVENYVDAQRKALRTDEAIYDDVVTYLEQAYNGNVTSDNPFLAQY